MKKILHRKNGLQAEKPRRVWGKAISLLLIAAVLAVSPLSCAFFRDESYTAAFGFRYDRDEEVPRRITFAAAGDNLIHSSIYKESCTDGAYDFSPIYREIAPFISSFDFAFVNQETPLGADGFSGYPRFCSPFAVGDALVEAGFDVIGIANNHMLDRGAAGLVRTREYLENTAELVVGGDTNGYRIIEREGVKIAFLAYTYSTNCDGDIDVPRISEARITRQVTEAREAADLVFVSKHWGIEYDIGGYVECFHPTTNQEHLAELLTELGADVVIGTHPHVLEGIEWKTASNGHKTLVAYSLGNLVSNMRFDKTLLGGILTLDIIKNKDYTYIDGARIYPIVCHYSTAYTGHKVYFLRDYTDELAECHGTCKQRNELPFCRETLIKYYENNIPAEFRPEHYA